MIYWNSASVNYSAFSRTPLERPPVVCNVAVKWERSLKTVAVYGVLLCAQTRNLNMSLKAVSVFQNL